MEQLSAAQIRKIEENKRLAIQRRQQQAPPPRPLIITKQFPNKSKKENTLIAKRETIKFTVCSSDRFAADMGFHAASIDIMKSVPGRMFGE